MKRTIIKAISVLLAVILTFTAAPLSGFIGFDLPKMLDFSILSKAEDAATSGTYGDNLTWNFDESTGTLTVSGAGEMHYYNSDNRPWESYMDGIKNIIIENGVTTISDSAFDGMENLVNVTIGNSVKIIGDSAFEDCTSLINITIPDTVTSIGGYAFSGTAYYYDTNKWEDNALYIGNHLISIYTDTVGDYKIKEGTLTIADYAFAWCESLTNVTIPDSISYIGECAFVECTKLTSIIIPDSVISIGRIAFQDCTSLTSITIPDTVKSIGDWAFYNTAYYNDMNNWDNNVLFIDNHLIRANTNISGNYEIKDCILTIADGAFEDCESLIEITIPESITLIGCETFRNCSSLTHVIISDGVKTIGEGAFEECYRLTEIIIPDGVTTIGNNAFCGCTSLESITIPDSVTIIGSGAFDNCYNLVSITIPDGVTTIGGAAFRECDKLTSVTIPDSVMTIGEGAFDDCNSLMSIIVDSNNEHYSNDEYGVLFNKDKTVVVRYPQGNTRTSYTIPGTVTTVGYCAFGDCENLTGITVPASVTLIDDYAFAWCANLTSITIPDSVTSIGECAFWWCESLTNISLSDSITSIEDYAFYYCRSLTSITIPNNVTSIGYGAFWLCESLSSITILNGVTSIGDWAFLDCHSLESITIPDSVTSIGERAFYNCTYLTTVVIGDGVTTIGECAFSCCENLTRITVDNNNQYYSSDEYGVLFNKNKTAVVRYPQGNTRTSYTIPDSVKTIDIHSFENCTNLNDVTIGEGVTLIGNSAFCGCDNFVHVYYYGTEEQWGEMVIDSGNDDLTYAIIHYNYEPGHYTETIITNPTCVNDGKKIYKCACGIDGEVEILALGHIFENDYCTACGVSINHDYCEYEITEQKDATCYGDGYTTYTCTVCGHYYTDINYSHHEFGEGVVVEEATCTKEGYGTQTCTICGFVDTYAIYVDHEYSDWVVTIEPTCTTEGEKIHSCIDCGYSESYTLNIQHNYGEWITVLEQTCTTEGMEQKTCIECGDVITNIIPIRHEYVNVGEGKFECSKCGFINTKYFELVASDYNPEIGDIITVDLYARNCLELECLMIDITYDNTALEIVDYSKYQSEIVNPNFSSDKIRYVNAWFDYTEGTPNITISFRVLNTGGEISFTIGESVDYNLKHMDIANAGPIRIGETNGIVSDSGIVVVPENNNVFPEGTMLNVSLLGEKEDEIIYDITLTNNGVEIQPNGNVTVKIPILADIDAKELSVYRVEEDGTYTDMKAVYENGYMVFVTNHFSKYIITSKEPILIGDVNSDSKVNQLDRTVFTRYLAKWDGYTEESINMTAADVNGDGKVNQLDRTILTRHIAKWEGYETLPYTK